MKRLTIKLAFILLALWAIGQLFSGAVAMAQEMSNYQTERMPG